MKDISFLNTSNSINLNNSEDTNIDSLRKNKKDENEKDILDLVELEVENNKSDSGEVEKDHEIKENNLIQEEIYHEALNILLDLIVKYQYEEIKTNKKTKGYFIAELLEIINKYKFVAKEIPQNMSNMLLRSIFPYVEIYNKIIENFKTDFTITIIEEDLKEARKSKKKNRNEFMRQKQLFLKCQSLFDGLKIFTSMGILNIVNALKIGNENKQERIINNIIIFLTYIFKYDKTQNLIWFLDQLYKFNVFKFLFTKKSILVIELLEAINKKFDYSLINKTINKKEVYNLPIEEILKDEHQRIIFKEKLIIKGIGSQKYELIKCINSKSKIIYTIFKDFQEMNLLYFIPIDKIEKDFSKSIYYSVEIMDNFMIKHKQHLLEIYEKFFNNKKDEIENKVSAFLDLKESSFKDSVVFSAEIEELSSSELSNAENLNTLEKKEVKQIRNIINESSSDQEIINSLNDEDFTLPMSAKNEELQKYLEIFECLRNFEHVTVNKQNIEHLIKQMELFNIALLKSLEDGFLKLSEEKDADEKALLSPVFYKNVDNYLSNTFLKHIEFHEKKLMENFNDYLLFSVVFYYNYSFFKGLKYVDVDFFKKAKLNRRYFNLLDNQQIIYNCYLLLNKSIKICEIKNDFNLCLFCKSKGFEKCKIFYILNLISISLFENETRNTKFIHFKISHLFMIYGLFVFLKENNIDNTILSKFCHKFLNEFLGNLKKDIFLFGKIFFNFNRKTKIDKKESNEIIANDFLDERVDIVNTPTDILPVDEKSIFKRLRRDILDDD